MKTMKKAVSTVLALTFCVSLGSGILAGCSTKETALVIMTEELNELYNPFYSTAGTDMDVVGQTQISMLSTDENGELSYGEDEPTVVLDYKKETNGGNTSYYFVLKNGITFSDGVPLTMNDVLFNLYVYLDPAYTGSTTMYSTDIVGLQTYRQQSNTTTDDEDSQLTQTANGYAKSRMDELINLYKNVGGETGSTSYYAEENDMVGNYRKDKESNPDAMPGGAIGGEAYKGGSTYRPGEGYLMALGLTNSEADIAAARKQLADDYLTALDNFKEELGNDYKSAKDSFTEEPYKSAAVYEGTTDNKLMTGFDEIVSFMYMEGYVTLKYHQEVGSVADKSVIERAEVNYPVSTVKDQQSAIDYVYSSMAYSDLTEILTYWATGTQLRAEFVAKAKDVILHEGKGDDLTYKSISGIKSLGHQTDTKEVPIGEHTYNVAHEHNDDGTPKNAGEYDVLRIDINGIDPKAQWNFSFTVAPYHYYSDPDKYPLDIEKEQYGVAWASYDFQKKVIQGTNSWGESKNKVPLGAGPYIATDEKNSDHPTAGNFFRNNVVYYKANPNFLLGEPKVAKMRYQVVSSSNALGVLQSGQVHFVTPQFTKANADIIDTQLKGRGFDSVSTWQLGYGYIGINAQYVQNLDLRKAIMSAMNPRLALDYYTAGTATNIAFPMSVVSWAYPRTPGATFNGSRPLENMETSNGHDYMQFQDDTKAIAKIKDYMQRAGVDENDPRLKLKFTIAGSSMVEHPAYAVFKHAMDLLNSCGWEVEVAPDTNALTKLATGSLAVWAAAWGSTIDPDMYQVYHKNSTATSVLAWGYDDILADTATYARENEILNKLAVVIDDARKTDVHEDVNGEKGRISLYREAMGYVLDLAVEMPLYQRQTLYAYNTKVINKDSLPKTVNSYSSPLSRIWEIELNK